MIAVVVVWLLVRGGSNPTNVTTTVASTTTSATSLGPVAASRAALTTFSAALKRPVYWQGAVMGDTYEFTQTSSGNIYVRYLPPGVRVGDPRAAFTVIGTYPYPHALATLRTIAKGKGQALPGGGLLFVSSAHPKSVHLAYPGVPYEIEVYDPAPGKALTIARSGRVRPVG